MDIVKKCRDVWFSATSETEEVTAIQVIMRLVKSSDLSNTQRREIFDVIGFSFLSRLLHTEKVPRGCSPTIYKSITLSVLSSFASDPEVAISDQLCSMTAEFKSILSTGSTSCGDSLIFDTVEVIHKMVVHEKSRRHLFENGIVSCMVKLFITDAQKRTKVLQILRIMGLYFKSVTWESDSAAFETFLLKMAKDSRIDRTDIVLCTTKCLLNTLCNPTSEIQGDEEWALELQGILVEVLKGNVSKELKHLAIKLASLVVDKCGVFWLGDGSKNSQAFFLVLIHNVCVEVQHALKIRTVEAVIRNTFVLSACFSIFEGVVGGIVEDNPWHLPQPFLKQFKASLQSAYKSVLDFLSMISAKWNSVYDIPELALRELTYASIRILCAWLTEDTYVLQDEVHKVIPFILNVCNECFLSYQPAEALCSDSQVSHTDLMRVFLTPLEHLILNDDLRAALLDQGLVDVMFQYMFYQWSVYYMNSSLETDVLCTLSEIVLTIVCMEVKVVSESEVFFNFLKFLLSIVPLLPSNYENLCLKANFSALGLLITRQHYKRIKSCETSFYRFLSFSVKFLWDSHHVEDGNYSISFVLVREYLHVWPDIMEQWFLGMHALSALLPVMPWITDFLMESGWPQQIISSLTRVSEKSIEGSVKYAYQAFLSALVRVSRNAVHTLLDCEAVYVCEKHKLKELEALLHR